MLCFLKKRMIFSPNRSHPGITSEGKLWRIMRREMKARDGTALWPAAIVAARCGRPAASQAFASFAMTRIAFRRAQSPVPALGSINQVREKMRPRSDAATDGGRLGRVI